MLKLVLLLIVVIIAYSMAAICRKSGDYSVGRIKKVLAAEGRITRWVILGTLICALLLTAGLYLRNASVGTANITLNYAEASKGQNSNKTRFSMSEILSDEVIAKIIEKGSLDVDPDTLKKTLSVMPAVQGNSYDKDSYHMATEFRLTYKAVKGTRHLRPYRLLQLAAESFKEVYIQNYAKNLTVLTFSDKELKELKGMDYYDAASYLSIRADNVSGLMNELAAESPGFRSQSGQSFRSLAAGIENLKQEQIDKNLLAYIRDKGISGDKREMLKRLSYSNTMLNYDRAKADAAYSINNQAVAMYAAEMTRVALIPTIDKDKDYYMGRTKVGLDILSLDAKASSEEAGRLLKRIKTNSAYAEALRQSNSGYGRDSVTEKNIEKIYTSLKSISASAESTAREYSDTRMNRVISTRIIYPSPAASAAIILLVSAMLFGALYMLSAAHRYLSEKSEN